MPAKLTTVRRLMPIFALLLALVVPAAGWAAIAADCPSNMRNQLDNASKQAANDMLANLFSKWQQPSSFKGLYCGSISDGFGQLNSLLSGSIFSSLINNVLRSIMAQACQAALQPIQSALSNLCIPNFSLNYSFSFGLGSANYCNGIQLLRVNPTYNSPQVTLPGYRLQPLTGGGY